MDATGEGEASTSTSTSTSAAASLAFVPRKLGAGGTRGRGRGRRPGPPSSATSARPRPPPQLLPHDVDFPEHTLLHASLSLDLGGRADASEEQRNRLVDRLVRRKLERLAPRTVDYVTLRRVTPSNESGGGDGGEEEGRVLVEVSTASEQGGARLYCADQGISCWQCIIRSPSPLTARRLVDRYNASKAARPDPRRRQRQRSTSFISLRLLTLPEQAAVWRDEVPKGVKKRARRRAKRRAGRAEEEEAKSVKAA